MTKHRSSSRSVFTLALGAGRDYENSFEFGRIAIEPTGERRGARDPGPEEENLKGSNEQFQEA